MKGIELKAGDVVVVLPQSFFKSEPNGVVQVGGHAVPASLIYAAWALGADQGVKVGLALGGGGSLLVLLGAWLLLKARRRLKGV
ncbi:MAG: hypothetical protein ABDH20_02045 [Thermus sp.]